MTGEITTLGEVISIGGVREKLTACKNHQITRVILPLSNKKHVAQLPEEFKKGFTIFYVKNITQLYKICFDTEEQFFEKNDFKALHEIGIEVDTFEEDVLNKLIVDQENILKRNNIEELLQ